MTHLNQIEQVALVMFLCVAYYVANVIVIRRLIWRNGQRGINSRKINYNNDKRTIPHHQGEAQHRGQDCRHSI